jgi:sigma-B regulation protein RsbU (phosphoserine phosphatase)
MAKLERYVRSRFSPDHFLSLFLAELDTARGVLTYCNAGHVLPIVLNSDGGVVEFEERAPALNIAPWQDFPRREHQLDPGDLLLVYTDGIVEKQNEQGEMFGKQRLLAAVRENAGRDLKTIRRAILAGLKSFGSSAALDDDVALVMLRRLRGRGT